MPLAGLCLISTIKTSFFLSHTLERAFPHFHSVTIFGFSDKIGNSDVNLWRLSSSMAQGGLKLLDSSDLPASAPGFC